MPKFIGEFIAESHRSLGARKVLCFLTLAFILAIGVPTLARPERLIARLENQMQVKGYLSLWTRPACQMDGICSLPRPLGAQWEVDLHFKKPKDKGAFQVAERRFVQNPWTVKLIWFWTNPKDGSAPFIALQTQLFRHTQEAGADSADLVAECTRYDAADAFAFLPPGSCSGKSDGALYGVSLSRDSFTKTDSQEAGTKETE